MAPHASHFGPCNPVRTEKNWVAELRESSPGKWENHVILGGLLVQGVPFSTLLVR